MRRPLIALLAAGALAVPLATTAGADPSPGQRYGATLTPVPHHPTEDNKSNATGMASLVLDGRTLTASIDARNLTPGAHVVHIHGLEQAEAECPSQDSRDDRVDDGLIDTVEGLDDYGPILTTFSTSGGTTPADALALDRAPMAGSNGRFSYQRTFTLAADVASNLEDHHIVVHGHDLNGDGTYPNGRDGSLGAGIPLEAELPVACGEINPRG